MFFKKKRVQKYLHLLALRQLRPQKETLFLFLLETDFAAIQQLFHFLALKMREKKLLRGKVSDRYSEKECVKVLWEELWTLY